MKPGKEDNLKTKFRAKNQFETCFAFLLERPSHAPVRLASAIVILTLWLASLACSGQFYYPTELTATAAARTAEGAVAKLVEGTPVPKTAVAAQNLNPVTITPYVPAVDPSLPSPTPMLLATLPETNATAAPNQPTFIAPPATPTRAAPQDSPIMYYSQAGDTLAGLAVRFNVTPQEITSPSPIPQEGLFDPGILLLIPPRLETVSSSKQLFPDSEVVYSPSALDLDLDQYVQETDGYLSTYREWRASGWHTGVQVVQRVAIENSINPRMLMVILEMQSHWIYSQPQSLAETEYPVGWLYFENEKKGLYYQLSWAVYQLNVGYYGWRDGTVTELTFPDGQTLRLSPDLNSGTVAVLYLFSRIYNQPQWAGILYGPDGMIPLYTRMFGNPYLRAQSVEPLFPATLTQPPLELPFRAGETWSLTGGPHSAWQTSAIEATGARAALDLAPSTTIHGCYESEAWVTASASGLVVRSESGVVIIDLDGDGYEQTGWNILYLHIAGKDRVALGTFVSLNDPIGHPSCEGGTANGTHVHIARKYNGEWILADGPMPFVLSGWRTHADKAPYKGTLTKDDKTVIASEYGVFESRVTRPKATP